MIFAIQRIEKDDWVASRLSELAHRISFSEVRDGGSERIDYALLVVNEENVPCGYMTCMELDQSTVYWQYGGAFPSAAKSIWTMKGYQLLADWHRARYRHILTFIENTNVAMLKMAMRVGFLVTGIRHLDGRILLEHSMKGLCAPNSY